MTAARVFIALALLSLPLACKEKRAERVAASYSSVTKPTAPLPATPHPHARDRVPVGLDSIPVEESYEERAATSITQASLRAQVTELEKELGF